MWCKNKMLLYEKKLFSTSKRRQKIKFYYKLGWKYPNGFVELFSVVLHWCHHQGQYSLLEAETQLTRQIVHQVLHT